MNIKNTKPIFYALIIFMSGFFAIEVQGQEIVFTSPGDGVVLSELTSITGTVSGLPKNGSVKITIVHYESDTEWNFDKGRGRYRWFNGPTGRWLATTLTGTTWTAPSSGYSLPGGSDLPDGKYAIYAQAFNSANRRAGSIFRRFFIIRR